jgi:hypothetical protein
MGRTARNDQSRSHPTLILAHRLGHARKLYRRGVAVFVCRGAKDDDGVESRE